MIDCYLKFIYSYFSVAIKITCKSDWISHCPTVPHPQNERILTRNTISEKATSLRHM